VLLYWFATVIAGPIVVAVVVGYISNAAEGVPLISIAALLVAGSHLVSGLELPQDASKTLRWGKRAN
jgi:hypothetical protein